MKKTIPKEQAKKEIEKFFLNVKNKTPKEIKKIKRFAMAYNLPLKEKRKLFCKKCLTPYSGDEKIRIKNKIKSIECKNCNYINRWKIR
jgi:RNase P subunit RPR2